MNLYARYLQNFAKKKVKPFTKKKRTKQKHFFLSMFRFSQKPNKYKVKCPTQRTPLKQFIKLFIK